MATNLTLSPKAMQKAHDLALVIWRTPKGRSKRNGREFYVIPASDGATAHWTAADGLGCTCKGFRRNGHCSHAEAVQIHNYREQAVVVPGSRSYDDVMDNHLVEAL